ncbi:MAG: hypothetical protein RLZZ621_1952 [Gemmatimonadota bacterium]
MTGQLSRVARVCALLNEHEANYVVVGGSAMQLWGSSRATRDVDIMIEPTRENAERVLAALCELPFRVAEDLLPDDLLRRAVTMIGDTPNVDVLTQAWNLKWPQATRDVAVFDVEGVPVPTVSIDALIVSKQTGRLQDQADIDALEEIRRQRDDTQ